MSESLKKRYLAVLLDKHKRVHVNLGLLPYVGKYSGFEEEIRAKIDKDLNKVKAGGNRYEINTHATGVSGPLTKLKQLVNDRELPIDISTFAEMDCEKYFTYQSALFHELFNGFIVYVKKQAFKFYMDTNVYNKFFALFVHDMLENEYGKLYTNGINYFAEKPFINCFEAAMIKCIRSGEFSSVLSQFVRYFTRNHKNIQVRLRDFSNTISDNSEKVEKVKVDLTKPDYDSDNSRSIIFQYTNVDVCATEVCYLDNLYSLKEYIVYIGMITLFSYMKQAFISHIRNCIGRGNVIEKLYADACMFYGRTVATMSKYVAETTHMVVDCVNKYSVRHIDNPFKDMFFKAFDEDFDLDVYLTDVFTPLYGTISKIESMNHNFSTKCDTSYNVDTELCRASMNDMIKSLKALFEIYKIHIDQICNEFSDAAEKTALMSFLYTTISDSFRMPSAEFIKNFTAKRDGFCDKIVHGSDEQFLKLCKMLQMAGNSISEWTEKFIKSWDQLKQLINCDWVVNANKNIAYLESYNPADEFKEYAESENCVSSSYFYRYFENDKPLGLSNFIVNIR